jgi:uncharacterized protein YndB with AHSA1/START domain
VARNEILVAAPAPTVFDVLTDPHNYPRWVVGASDVRTVESGWPAPGTAFHHKVGVGPIKLPDETRVLEVEAPRRLVLRARARPLGTARVALELEPDGRRHTRVTLVEDGGDWLTRLAFNPLVHLAVRIRNAESLRRLKRLAEQRGR